MKLLSFRFVADHNVGRSLLAALEQRGVEVVAVESWGMSTATDAEILARAVAEDRVVLTQDRDFGGLAVAGGNDGRAIVLLRPGHAAAADPESFLDVLRELDVERPFVVVAERRGASVRVRVRRLAPTSTG